MNEVIEQPKTGSVDRIETCTTPMPCSQKKLRGQGKKNRYITVGQYNQEPKKECVPRLRQPVGSRCGLSQQRPPVLRSCCTVEQMPRSDRLHGFHSQTPPNKPPSLPDGSSKRLSPLQWLPTLRLTPLTPLYSVNLS